MQDLFDEIKRDIAGMPEYAFADAPEFNDAEMTRIGGLSSDLKRFFSYVEWLDRSARDIRRRHAARHPGASCDTACGEYPERMDRFFHRVRNIERMLWAVMRIELDYPDSDALVVTREGEIAAVTNRSEGLVIHVMDSSDALAALGLIPQAKGNC